MKKLPVLQKGFTLIELLVVIAVLGVLAAGVLVGIDPVDRINSGNDARVQSDVGTIGRASEAYAAAKSGLYPFEKANLVSNGDLKVVPTKPSGYTDYAQQIPGGCTVEGDADCTSYIVTGQLKSKKFTATPVWRYESSTGKSCAVADTSTACP